MLARYSLPTALALATLLTALTLPATQAEASPKMSAAKLKLPKIKPPKINLDKLKPKIRFVPYAKLYKGVVRLSLTAHVTIAGKTKRISIFNMSMKKTGKTMQVNRKVGKLYVSLKVSWEGTRTLTISGTARYLKFKIPVPRLRVNV